MNNPKFDLEMRLHLLNTSLKRKDLTLSGIGNLTKTQTRNIQIMEMKLTIAQQQLNDVTYDPTQFKTISNNFNKSFDEFQKEIDEI